MGDYAAHVSRVRTNETADRRSWCGEISSKGACSPRALLRLAKAVVLDLAIEELAKKRASFVFSRGHGRRKLGFERFPQFLELPDGCVFGLRSCDGLVVDAYDIGSAGVSR